MYHQQLSYCVTQFVEKDPQLAQQVLLHILEYWPRTFSAKEVCEGRCHRRHRQRLSEPPSPILMCRAQGARSSNAETQARPLSLRPVGAFPE